MGNRRKIKDNRLRLKKNPGIARGLLSKPSERPHVPTADEIFANVPIPAEDEDPQVIKTVPAKHKGTRVGDADIYDDGSVLIRFDEDAPQWALDEIKQTSASIGYNLDKGTYDGPS